jgi:hypothetical protein
MIPFTTHSLNCASLQEKAFLFGIETKKVTEIVTVETRFSSREMLSLPFMTAGTLTNDTANRHKYSACRKARRIISHLFVSDVNLQ